MKILSANQMYAADKATIKSQQITSDQLMERAATQLYEWLHLRLQGQPVKLHLFCGIGNNGGDGLALARLLHEEGYPITVYIINYAKKRSGLFMLNLKRLKDLKIWPEVVDNDENLPEIHHDDIIVDAIFGIGLSRAPAHWVITLFEHLHASKAFTLSIDLPSGLYTNKVPSDSKAVVKANHTLTFQTPKLVFFLPQTGIYSEHFEIINIGLDQTYLNQVITEYELIAKHEVLQFYQPREKFTHKGTYGHSLIIGGSFGKIGAVHLAARACLHAGSGLVTAFVPDCGYLPLQTNLPEAMVLTDKNDHYLTRIAHPLKVTVVGIGMGMGTHEKTLAAFKEFLMDNRLPLVIDADALNLLSENKELLTYLPKSCVLTPHPKELERLIGSWKDDFEKLKLAKAFVKKYQCVLVLKGANTITVTEDKAYINTTGNPGMATGGTGDVLTGIITGLIAQGYKP